MIAARRRYDSIRFRVLTLQPVDEGNATTNLERAGWRVVFVLDPDGRARLLADLRPDQLRRRQHLRIDLPRCCFEFVCRKDGSPSPDATENTANDYTDDSRR